MQTQQPFWKFFQKHNVVNVVVKTSVAAVVGFITVGAVAIPGEGLQTRPATCTANDRTYITAHGDTWSSVAARFHLTQGMLTAHNQRVNSGALSAKQQVCLPPEGFKAIIRTQAFTNAEVAVRVKKSNAFASASRARAVPKPKAKKTPVAKSSPTPVEPVSPVESQPAQVEPIQNAPVQTPQVVSDGATAPTGVTGYSNSFPYPSCTWWANQRNYQRYGVFVPWRTNANAWQWTARAYEFGWKVSSRPSVGSIIVLQAGVQGAGGWGHVAFVEQVLSNGSVIASNMNWGANPYAVVNVRFSPGYGVSFIRR